MSPAKPAASPRYIARIQNACEVALIGLADWNWWRDWLQREQLQPLAQDGQAVVTVSAVRSRWLGIGFCELVVTVATSSPNGDGRADGAFLIAAYNSRSWLAWCERTFFRTPYDAAGLNVAWPGGFGLTTRAGAVVKAARSADDAPRLIEDRVWAGAVALPNPRDSALAGTEEFFVRIAGQTEVYPFDPNHDQLAMSGAIATVWFPLLTESHCQWQEWHVRRRADHARSQTFSRR